MIGIPTIATSQKNFELRGRVAEQSASMDKAGIELSTGFKQDVFEGARGAAGDSLTFRAQLDSTEAYVRSNGLLAGRLESVADSMTGLREDASEFANLMISGSVAEMNRDVLQNAARSALEQITNKMNSTYAGSFLFSGLASDTEAVQLNPDWSVTYTGDTTGSLSAKIDDETTMDYGIRGDDAGFRDVLDALTVVASTNLFALSDAAFDTLRDTTISSMNTGLERLTEIQTRLGDNQGIVERTVERQELLTNLYNDAIIEIEGVDAEEAAVRLTSIQNQLQATYTVTARMSEMSLLNYI